MHTNIIKNQHLIKVYDIYLYRNALYKKQYGTHRRY